MSGIFKSVRQEESNMIEPNKTKLKQYRNSGDGNHHHTSTTAYSFPQTSPNTFPKRPPLGLRNGWGMAKSSGVSGGGSGNNWSNEWGNSGDGSDNNDGL